MKYLLYPFSVIYNFASVLNRKFTRPRSLPVPVISVGNITWGGSGKTPVTEEIAKYILSLDKTPVILSRGYARKNKTVKNVVVRDKEKILSDISSSGDEPYMMANSVECPVIVGADRIKSAELAARFNPDVFVLDDGFQHWKLRRDLDIVCVNSLNPFGNGMVIPAGILREKPAALKRADMVILTNCNLCGGGKLADLKTRIKSVTGKYPVCVSYGNFNITRMSDGVSVDDAALIGGTGKFVVLSALGSPDNFINTVINLGVKIKNEVIFSDHHKYVFDDINAIVKSLADNEKIITTSKDAVKIGAVADGEMKKKIYVLNVSIIFESGKKDFEEAVNALLQG